MYLITTSDEDGLMSCCSDAMFPYAGYEIAELRSNVCNVCVVVAVTGQRSTPGGGG